MLAGPKPARNLLETCSLASLRLACVCDRVALSKVRHTSGNVLGHARSTSTDISTSSVFGEQHQVLGSYYYFRFGSICTSSLHLALFSEVVRHRFERSWTWNAQKHCSSP